MSLPFTTACLCTQWQRVRHSGGRGAQLISALAVKCLPCALVFEQVYLYIYILMESGNEMIN